MSEKGIIFLTDAMMEPFAKRFPTQFNRDSTRTLFAIRAVAQQINDDALEWLAPFGLNSASYNYLIVLFAAGGHALSQNEIRRQVHTSHASVTQMISTLERDGLVARSKNPADGRSLLVSLTAKGLSTIEAALPVHHANIEAGMRGVSAAERTQLLEILLKVNAGFEARRQR
jgi:DNA-binding MarR family transcriptional regulator